MQSLNAPESRRRDPAPSRWAFRFQRLWLTPFFRRLLRVGLPMFSVVFFAGWFITEPTTREAMEQKFAELRRSVAERPEFMVKLMAVDGASAELDEDIREVLPVDFPISSFDLDLDEMKTMVEELDAVAMVDLRVRPGGVLQLHVTERIPAVIWRNGSMLELLDIHGRRVASVRHRSDRADLPLIVGEGADQVVKQALDVAFAASPLDARLRGLVRVGERRWDVVLTRDQRIMLPQDNPVMALEQVIALDQAQDLLARDISDIDMRNAQRPTLRMGEPAVEELRRIKAIELGDAFQ